MNDYKSNVQTGVLVSIAIVLLMLSILFFGGDRAFLNDYIQYRVKFRSTQGLNSGSVVSLAGMEVGNIHQIDFDNENNLIATLNINAKFKEKLKSDSIAAIKTQGALGDKYIYITPGLTSGEVLKPNDFIRADSQSDIFDIISGKANDLSVFVDVMKELNQLLHNLNADGKSALLVENIVNASQNVSKIMNDPNIRGSFLHLKNILGKVDSGDGTLGQLVNDSTLHDRLVGLLGDTPRNKYLKPLLREAIKQNEQKK